MAVYGVNAGLARTDGFKVGLYPVVPNSSTPEHIDMKGVQNVTVVITVSNTTGVAGSAITLKQATNDSDANVKAVAFTKAYANLDISAGDTFTEMAVSSDTFTTATTSNTKMVYLIEVDVNQLDLKSGFRYLRAGTGNSTNATIGVFYIINRVF